MTGQLLNSLWIASAVSVLIAQPLRAEVVQITKVQVDQIENGIEVILETPAPQQLQVLPRIDSNTYIADIPNTQLRLKGGNTFRQDNPTTGITSVTVTNQDVNSIRVTVTGSEMPSVQLFDSDEGLIFGITTVESGTEPQPTPETPQKPATEAPEAVEEPEEQVEPEETPAEQIQGSDEQAEEDEPIEIVVTGEQETGYVAPNATTATRTDTPIRDIPQSIQVVPEQVLEEQQVNRLREATRNVSGVFQGNTFGNSGDAFIIRGFEQEDILRNGFRDSTGNSSFRETANLERIEILKGPASVLYGTLQPGGIINLVTKQPLSEPFYSFELDVGNRSFVRPSIDLSGPLNSDRTLLYRLNAVYESADDFRNFDQNIERFFISPVLTWRLSDRTDLTFELEYLDDERPFDRGLVAIGDKVADIPYDRILGEPDDFSAREQLRSEYRFEHRFSENWTLRNGFQFFLNDSKYVFVGTDLELDEISGELNREISDQDGLDRNYSFQTNLVGEFATGSVEHTLLFGVDLFREEQDFDIRFQFEGVPTQNIFNPVYGIVSRPELEEFQEDGFFGTKTDFLGIYLQDQITFFDNLILLVGGRFDIVDQKTTLGGDFGDSEEQQQQQAFSPRVGIVYKPIEPLSVYASFSQSFVPNTDRTLDGSILEPERGTQFEAGIKGEFLDGRLFATLAAFNITKSNIAVPVTDPDSGLDYSVAIGEQRSHGIELDVIGQILPGWNIIASYTYTDAEVTEDNGSPLEGNRLYGVAENAASLWTTYEIQQGNLQGLGFGLGLFFVGERQGDLENTFQVDSYLRTDAAIFYQRNNWRTAINIQNLFDVNYIESTGNNRGRINPGEPFTVIGSVSVQF